MKPNQVYHRIAFGRLVLRADPRRGNEDG